MSDLNGLMKSLDEIQGEIEAMDAQARVRTRERRAENRRKERARLFRQRVAITTSVTAIMIVVLSVSASVKERRTNASQTPDTALSAFSAGTAEESTETPEALDAAVPEPEPEDPTAPETAPAVPENQPETKIAPDPDADPEVLPSPPAVQEPLFRTVETKQTIHIPENTEEFQLDSAYAVVVDAATGEIVVARNTWYVIPPASMTKVLTLLVAVEHIDALDDTYTIRKEVTDYCWRHNCSVAGFLAEETVSVRDLLYGCILPSGADAAISLAEYAAGSEEAFVGWMNEKIAALGLSATAHFTNVVGLYDENHACTVRDMAVMMRAAMDNPLCREVLDARTWRTSPTEQHPEGILLSNWFLRRIEDRFTDSRLSIHGGKTGYVTQSGSCAVSYASRSDGKNFICVTAKAPGSWKVIYDHTKLYQTYCS